MLPKSSPGGRASSSLSRWLATAADEPCAPVAVAIDWLGAVVSAGLVSVDDAFWSAAPMLDMVSSVDMNTPAQQIAEARLRASRADPAAGSVKSSSYLARPFSGCRLSRNMG